MYGRYLEYNLINRVVYQFTFISQPGMRKGNAANAISLEYLQGFGVSFREEFLSRFRHFPRRRDYGHFSPAGR